jgi:avirulence protein
MRPGASLFQTGGETKVLDAHQPSRNLPGPHKESSLPERQQKLIGVARWPDPEFNQEDSVQNQAYGLDFLKCTRHAGQLLANGKLNNFRELWHHSAEWRASKAFSFDDIYDFRPRPPRNDQKITDLRNQYRYFLDRISESKNGKRENPRYPCINIDVDSFQQIGQIGDESIPLTCVKVLRNVKFLFGDDKDKDLSPEFVRKNRPYLYMALLRDGTADTLVHTEPKYINKILDHAETLFSKLTTGQGLQEEKLKILGEMHWWVANAMPDARGSAAKTEFCIRSLANANGIELPPFKRGILPDLDAMDSSMSCADFSANYEDMFEWQDEAQQGASSSKSNR